MRPSKFYFDLKQRKCFYALSTIVRVNKTFFQKKLFFVDWQLFSRYRWGKINLHSILSLVLVEGMKIYLHLSDSPWKWKVIELRLVRTVLSIFSMPQAFYILVSHFSLKMVLFSRSNGLSSADYFQCSNFRWNFSPFSVNGYFVEGWQRT